MVSLTTLASEVGNLPILCNHNKLTYLAVAVENVRKYEIKENRYLITWGFNDCGNQSGTDGGSDSLLDGLGGWHRPEKRGRGTGESAHGLTLENVWNEVKSITSYLESFWLYLVWPSLNMALLCAKC